MPRSVWQAVLQAVFTVLAVGAVLLVRSDTPFDNDVIVCRRPGGVERDSNSGHRLLFAR